MSNLTSSLVPLDKGLNLQTAKIVAPAGSVLDTLNYEQVDFQGQKRIDGFARYDGNMLSVLDDYLIVQVDMTDFPAYAGTWNAADGAIISTAAGILGICVHVTGGTVYIAVINQNLVPVVGDTIYWVENGVNTNGVPVQDSPDAVIWGHDLRFPDYSNPNSHYNKLLEYTQVLRSRVGELPGNIIGLHWFRDRLYAVADVTTVSLAGTAPAIHPNDTLVIAGDTAKVLDVITKANTRVLFLSTMTPALWAVENTTVTRNAVGVGAIANGFEALTASEELASFFESRTEAQVLTEDGPSGPYDFGWRFVDHGWKIGFENATSLYGSLPSLNQNIKGLGIQGPTSVVGDNGRPLVVTQKVSVANEGTQVNGWKNSQSPTSYVLESDNLIDVDNDTIYADAYISWDGATGVVTGLTDTLTEYAASSTVVIEL